MQSRRLVALAGGLVVLALLGVLLWPGAAPEDGVDRTSAAGSGRESHAAQPLGAGRAGPDAADAEAEAARQALDAAQKALSLLGRPSSREQQSRREALRLALDSSADRVDRVRALRALGRFGDAEALDVIERVLRGDAPDEVVLQAAVALGYVSGAAADRLLASQLALETGPARLGAIQALGLRGEPGDVAQLQALLLDEGEAASAREAAADALARLEGEAVVAALAQALDAEDEALAESALSSLAARPWPESAPAIRALLADPDLDPEREVAVLEALSDSSPEAAELLIEYASRASDPEARSVAVESLAMLVDAEGLAERFRTLSLEESDPQVRSELYEALALHADWEHAPEADAALVDRVLAESDASVRLQGSRMLASRLRHAGDPALGEAFDRQVLPWLAERAGDASTGRYERLVSIEALKLGGTDASRRALTELAEGRDPVAAPAARKALEFPRPR